MATVLHGLSLSNILVFFFFFELCFCFNPKYHRLSTTGTSWSSAGATWYGSRDGAGSDGNIYISIYIYRERERERIVLFVLCTNKIYLCMQEGLVGMVMQCHNRHSLPWLLEQALLFTIQAKNVEPVIRYYKPSVHLARKKKTPSFLGHFSSS